jgi:cytochrome c biogenesis protein CcmG, thiol:disulfide interchange protein DsbE
MIVPTNMAARVRAVHARPSRVVARQIRKMGLRHGFRATAPAGIGCFRRHRSDEQRHGNCLQHLSLWFCFLAGICFTLASSPASAAPEIGASAPALILTDLDGTSFDLGKLRGKVVLVNYWATWCVPCRKEMPKLDAFYQRYHVQGLEIIGISIDFPRDFAKMRKAAATVHYPTAVASAITDDGFGKPKGVPITWIIDAGGAVRDMMIEVRDELLNGIVVPLLPH